MTTLVSAGASKSSTIHTSDDDALRGRHGFADEGQDDRRHKQGGTSTERPLSDLRAGRRQVFGRA